MTDRASLDSSLPFLEIRRAVFYQAQDCGLNVLSCTVTSETSKTSSPTLFDIDTTPRAFRHLSVVSSRSNEVNDTTRRRSADIGGLARDAVAAAIGGFPMLGNRSKSDRVAANCNETEASSLRVDLPPTIKRKHLFVPQKGLQRIESVPIALSIETHRDYSDHRFQRRTSDRPAYAIDPEKDEEDVSSQITGNRRNSLRSASHGSQGSVVVHDRSSIDIPGEKGSASFLPIVEFITTGAKEPGNQDVGKGMRLLLSFHLAMDALNISRSSAAGSKLLNSQTTQSRETSRGKIIFVGATSIKTLLGAIADTRRERDCWTGPCATPELAKLEGLHYGLLDKSAVKDAAHELRFDWECGSFFVRNALSSTAGKVCCAFLQLDEESGRAKVLSSLQFIVKETVSKALSMQEQAFESNTKVMTTSRHSFEMQGSPTQARPSNVGTSLAIDEAQSRRRTSTSSSRRGLRGSVFPLETTDELGEIPIFEVNHLQLESEDVEADSPVFRAALASLQRRCESIRKSARGLHKAAAGIIASIDGMQNADAQFELAMNDTKSWAPSTHDVLVREHVVKKRLEATRLREKESRLLVVHVLAPMDALIEKCRHVQSRLSAFESESKVFYSATQKWLSLKSNQTANSGPMSTDIVTSYPAGIVHDKSSVKQARENEKQKLRQATYDLSRFSLYLAILSLHGGEAELSFASHCLGLASWYTTTASIGSSEGSRIDDALSAEVRILQQIDARVREEGIAFHERKDQAFRRCRELEHCIAELREESGMLQAEILGQRHGGKASAKSPLQSTERRSKFKSFWSSLSSGRSVPPATEGARQHIEVVSRSSAPIKHPQNDIGAFDRSQSSKEAAESKTPRPLENEAILQHPRERASEIIGSRDSTDEERKVSQASARKDPETSLQPASSPRIDSDTKQYSDAEQQSIMAAMTERKKEGVLWVLSKEISAIDDTEATRVANKSQHWTESWVVLSGSGHLGEYSGWKDGKTMKLEPTQPLIDLRFATARAARGLERRFVFEVVGREKRRLYQAASEDDMRGWIAAIRYAIECLLNGTSSVRQVDKVARASVLDFDNEFGLEGSKARQVLDEAVLPASLMNYKAFSQSLTDLGITSGGAGGGRRLFQRGHGKEVLAPPSKLGHLSGKSEFSARDPRRLDVSPEEDFRRPLPHRSRGISNTTPLSGYISNHASVDAAYNVQQPSQTSKTDQPVQADQAARHTCEDDQRIAEAVERHFGAPSSRSIVSRGRESSEPGSQFPKSIVEPAPLRDTNFDPKLPEIPSRGQSARRASLESSLQRRVASTGTCFSTSKYGRANEIQEIAQLPANRQCGDCGKTNPRWASWALYGRPCCIFLCIGCSGIHRSLGVRVSKVKSVDLDDWSEDQIQAARDWGNQHVNACFEAMKPADATVDSLGGMRTRLYWKQKYVERAWFKDVYATGMPTGNGSGIQEDAKGDVQQKMEERKPLGFRNEKLKRSRRRPLSTLT